MLAFASAAYVGEAAAAPTEPGQLVNELQPAQECVKCHAFPNPQSHAGEPLVTPASWQVSMMGNSARDPVFWAGVAIAHQDDPEHTNTCVRCHVPRAFVEGRGGAIGIDELEPDDLSGVDCELCHRMLADEATPAGDALYEIDDVLGLDGDVAKRGPWDYEGEEPPKHGWAVDTYLADSRSCGTCHDVTTGQTRVDAGGASLGVPFGEQRTYSEWKGSAYAVAGPDFKSCQDCHMPEVADVAGCAEFNTQEITHPTGGRRHDLAGANRRMVELLKGVYGKGAGGAIDDAFFDVAIANIDATLATAATLEVTAPDAVDLTAGIPALSVKVINNTGHKLPTGYSEGRVMWLEVTARYGDQVVYQSGAWTAGEGLVDDPQLRTYEGNAVEHGTSTRFHLLRNNTWVVDSRIPPKGLKKDIETDPVGDRYTLLPDDTWPNFDEVTYNFASAEVVDATPDVDDELALSVRLLYFINTPEYVEFLADENRTNQAGQAVAELFDAAGPSEPLELASWSKTVPLTGFVPPGTETTGSTGGETGTPTSGETPTSSGGSSGVGTSGASGDGTSGGSSGSGGEQEGEGGCGCRSHGLGGLLWVPGVLLLRRRRR